MNGVWKSSSKWEKSEGKREKFDFRPKLMQSMRRSTLTLTHAHTIQVQQQHISMDTMDACE